MANDPRGTIIQQGNLMRINNALVEESFCSNNSNGYIVVSYSVHRANNITMIEHIRLNLNRNTVILNAFGQRLCTCCINEGMWVNAVFSGRMTRSIPPQANALFITVTQRRPQPPSAVTTDRIAYIDTDNRFLYTGNPNDISDQTRYVITGATTITDRNGRPVRLNNLRPGQMVRITHANFQTASIPPQTTAFHIQIL